MGEETILKAMLIIFNIIFIAFISGIIIFIREYRIKKRKHSEKLEQVNLLHKKELLKTQIEIQKQTMKYIGREIHDNVGQRLTLSSLYLQQLAFDSKNSKTVEKINSINDIISESLDELRHLSKSLVDDTIADNPICKLLENECKRINDLQKCKVIFKNDFQLESISYQIKSILVRITQEFLQNSIKHSECKIIEVALFNIRNEIHLELQDDGAGFDIENLKSKGIGLKNIQKRVEIINGIFNLKSNKHSGTKLTVLIP